MADSAGPAIDIGISEANRAAIAKGLSKLSAVKVGEFKGCPPK